MRLNALRLGHEVDQLLDGTGGRDREVLGGKIAAAFPCGESQRAFLERIGVGQRRRGEIAGDDFGEQRVAVGAWPVEIELLIGLDRRVAGRVGVVLAEGDRIDQMERARIGRQVAIDANHDRRRETRRRAAPAEARPASSSSWMRLSTTFAGPISGDGRLSSLPARK